MDERFILTVKIADIINRRSLITKLPIRNVQYFYCMHLPFICKDTNSPRIHAGEHIFILCICRFFIPLVRLLVDRFCVTETIH